MSAITSGLEAFTSTFLVESLDAAVAGDFDIGDILKDKDSALSGVSAGLTAGINLETFVGNLPKDSVLNDALISGFGGLNPKLTMKGILDGAIDGAISSGLSSAVYGTDFLEGFSSSMVNTLVNLTLADVQYEIGELGVIRGPDGKVIETKEGWGEGSFPHAILHGLAGCAAGAVQNGGQGCAAGAAAGLAQSLYAGTVEGQNLSDEQQERNAQLIGALAGFILSGGDGANVSMAAGIARSAITNNRQLHREESVAIAENAEAYAKIAGYCDDNGGVCSEADVRRARAELTQEALRRVDARFARSIAENSKAGAFLESLAEGYIAGTDQLFFREDDYYDSFKTNRDYLSYSDIVELVALDDNASIQTQRLAVQIAALSGAGGFAPDELVGVLSNPELRAVLAQSHAFVADPSVLHISALIASAIETGDVSGLDQEIEQLQAVINDPALRGDIVSSFAFNDLERLKRVKTSLQNGNKEAALDTLTVAFNSETGGATLALIAVDLVGGKVSATRLKNVSASVKSYLKSRRVRTGIPAGSIQLKSAGAAVNAPKDFKVFQTPKGDKIYESPNGVVYSSLDDIPEVIRYNSKHIAPKNVPWKNVVESTLNKTVGAKFRREINVDEITLKAWETGTPVTNGKPWKVYKSDEVIGAKSGKETPYMRVEMSPDGKLHGHPIPVSEYRKLLR